MSTPSGKPTSIQLYLRPAPKSRLGERVPQKIAEVKKVLWPGQVNLNEASAVQMFLKPIAKLKIADETKQ